MYYKLYFILVIIASMFSCEGKNKSQMKEDELLNIKDNADHTLDVDSITITLNTDFAYIKSWMEIRSKNEEEYFKIRETPIITISNNILYFSLKDEKYKIKEISDRKENSFGEEHLYHKIELEDADFYFDVLEKGKGNYYWSYTSSQYKGILEDSRLYSFYATDGELANNLEIVDVILPFELQHKRWVPIYKYDREYRAGHESNMEYNCFYTFETHVNYSIMESHTYAIVGLKKTDDGDVCFMNDGHTSGVYTSIKWIDKEQQIIQYGNRNDPSLDLYMEVNYFDQKKLKTLPAACFSWIEYIKQDFKGEELEKQLTVANPLEAANVRMNEGAIVYDLTADIDMDGKDDRVIVFDVNWNGEDTYVILGYTQKDDGTHRYVLDAHIWHDDPERGKVSSFEASKGVLTIKFQLGEKVEKYKYDPEKRDWLYKAKRGELESFSDIRI